MCTQNPHSTEPPPSVPTVTPEGHLAVLSGLFYLTVLRVHTGSKEHKQLLALSQRPCDPSWWITQQRFPGALSLPSCHGLLAPLDHSSSTMPLLLSSALISSPLLLSYSSPLLFLSPLLSSPQESITLFNLLFLILCLIISIFMSLLLCCAYLRTN